MFFQDRTKIESVKLVNGQLEVIRRVPSNIIYACNPPIPAPDKIFKDFYGVEDGCIKLLKTIIGEVTPASLNPETITFNENI